jgi:hypothetical protein
VTGTTTPVTSPSLDRKETNPGYESPTTTRAIRRLLLALFVVGVFGTAADLLLTGHFEDLWQLAPLIVIALSVVALVVHAVRPSRSTVRLHQAVMLLFIASGLVGTFLHYRANIEFELEMYPGLSGIELLWKAIQGASPPSLAPGAMAALGFLGLIYTYKHPSLSGDHDRTGAST